MSDERITALYRRYGPMIFARCMHLLRDAASAEDATQETFVRVYRHIANAPDDGEVLRWVYRIATNYCLNEIRNSKRRAVPVANVPERGGSGEEALADRDAVSRIIRDAPEKLRTIAWLHLVDGLDQTEVARVLGISRRTVVTRVGEFQQHAHRMMGGAA